MREKGYNLIEVIIATALLAWVLISVIGLFSMGQTSVHTGNLQTKAASLGQHIFEDLSKVSSDERFTIFGIATGTATTQSFTYQKMADADVDSNPPDSTAFKTWYENLSYVDQWRYHLRDVPGGKLLFTIKPAYVKSASPAKFGDSVLITYDLTVQFTQGKRTVSTNFKFAL